MNEELRQETIERIKHKTRPTDAKPLFRALVATRDKLSQESKDRIKKAMTDAFEETGKLYLARMFLENRMTEEEWNSMQEKYGFTLADISVVLQGFYHKFDIIMDETDKVTVLTQEDTRIWEHKEFIKERFGVVLTTPSILLEDEEFKKCLEEKEKK